MDDPMVRSRLGRANGTRLWGFPIPSGAPSFFLIRRPRNSTARRSIWACGWVASGGACDNPPAHAQHQAHNFIRRHEFSRMADSAGPSDNSRAVERCRVHDHAGKNCGSRRQPDRQRSARAGAGGALQDAVRPCRRSEFQRALNALLPPAIRIVDAEEVGPDFHARWLAQAKTYRYRIYRGRVLPPFDYGRRCTIRGRSTRMPWPQPRGSSRASTTLLHLRRRPAPRKTTADRNMMRVIHSSELMRRGGE